MEFVESWNNHTEWTAALRSIQANIYTRYIAFCAWSSMPIKILGQIILNWTTRSLSIIKPDKFEYS